MLQALLYLLVFVAGIVFAVLALLCVGWYVTMQERVQKAEQSRKEMEDAILQVEASQKAAAEALQTSINELVKRRQVAPQPAPVTQPKDPKVEPSVKERLKQAVELTAKQNKLNVKNGPVEQTEFNELELKKLSILKTILADGLDPVITIRYSTGEQDMLLSNYIQSITKGLA